MKNFLLLLIFPLLSFGQNKKELLRVIEKQEVEIVKLNEEIINISDKLESNKLLIQKYIDEIKILKEELKQKTADSPTDLAKIFFEQVKRRDYSKNKDFLFCYDELSDLGKSVIKKGPSGYGCEGKYSVKSMEEFYLLGVKYGINWNDTRFGEFLYMDTDNNEMSVEEISSNFSNFMFTFNYKEKTYIVEVEDGLLINNKFKFYDPPNYFKELNKELLKDFVQRKNDAEYAYNEYEDSYYLEQIKSLEILIGRLKEILKQ